jgi:hypothetical protein
MANPARSRSKLNLVWLWLALSGCGPEQPKTDAVPSVFISVNQPGWQRREGQLWLNNQPFSGYQYDRDPAGNTLFVGGYRAGKAEGLYRYWYPNQRPKEVRRYRHNWQQDEQRGWHESGRLAFVCQFRDDVYEGRRQEWYTDGQPARNGHYHNGQENGLQQLWFANGRLRANYVARAGRNYGFTGVKNCANVWDSVHVSP